MSERTRGEYRQESCAFVFVDVQSRGQERSVGAKRVLGAVTSLCGPLPSPPLNSLAFIGVYPSQYFSYFFFFDCMSPIALLQIKLGRAQTSGVSHSATFNLWEM